MKQPATAIRPLLALLALLPSDPSFAGGLDKPNLISGRLSGAAGVATSFIGGAESIFTNPAGLEDCDKLSLTLDFTAGMSWNAAPLVVPNSVRGTGPLLTPLFGAFATFRVTDRVALGGGLFVAGGLGADYGIRDGGPLFPSIRPEFKTQIGILESSLGIAAEILPGLRLGAAWRITQLKAEAKTATQLDADGDGAPDALLATEFTNLSGTAYSGFRFGAQYRPPNGSWGVGAHLRTKVDIDTDGDSRGAVEAANTPTVYQLPGGDITLQTRFPLLASLGAHWDPVPGTRLMTEYSFIWNTRIGTLNASGDPLAGPVVGSLPASTFSTTPGWSNQNLIRVGAEHYLNPNRVVRVGYAWGSQVVPATNPSPFFTPPSTENLFTAGLGLQLADDGKSWLDLAAEYSWHSADVTQAVPPALNGEYSFKTFGLFVGFTRNF